MGRVFASVVGVVCELAMMCVCFELVYGCLVGASLRIGSIDGLRESNN
jgi:hypothetical protein